MLLRLAMLSRFPRVLSLPLLMLPPREMLALLAMLVLGWMLSLWKQSDIRLIGECLSDTLSCRSRLIWFS